MAHSFITNKNRLLSDIITGILPKSDAVDILYPEKTCSGLRQIKERVPKTIPPKMLYNKYFIFSCYAFLFILDFPNLLSKPILQFHAFLF